MTASLSSGDLVSDASPPLAWLRDLLWPDWAGFRTSVERTDGDAGRETFAWLALPTVSSPTLLAPSSKRAGGASLLQFNDSMSLLGRTRKLAVGALIRSGGGSALTRDRFVVRSGPRVEPAMDLVGSMLPDILNVPRVEVAISIGRQLRPNLKPVLQIMSPEGEVLAYAKLGWNPLTRGLVQNEAMVLSAWSHATPRLISVPDLLYEGIWNEMAITIMSPVPHRYWSRSGRAPTADVVMEVAELGGLERSELATSPYLARLDERIRALPKESSVRASLRSAVTRLERSSGEVELSFGRDHGDWTPWNMRRSGRRLLVWDWERSARPVPLGFDVLHFWFESAFHKKGREVDDASLETLERAGSTFIALGIPRDSHALLHRLFLVERSLRLEEGRAAGMPVDERLSRGIVTLIERGDAG